MGEHLVAPPNTPAADVVRNLLEGCDPVVVAHSERSYQFAALLAATDRVQLDDEVLYLGTILHDVGLAPSCGGAERFEVRGANTAREMLLDHGMDRVRAENVWDVIALHASTPLARHKSPETLYANRGISIDIRGAGSEGIHPLAIREVLDRWPRAAFPDAFGAVLIDEVQTHVDTVRLSWMESIAAKHVAGYTPSDFLATLHQSRTFC